MNAKKHFFAALSILLCVLMLLPLTGCGGSSVTLEDPTPAEFESVTKMRYTSAAFPRYLNEVEYRDMDAFVFEAYDTANRWLSDVARPVVLDPHTGERRDLGLTFPYESEDGTLSIRSVDQYWYDGHGSWYMILRSDSERGLYTYSEETGELRLCPVDEELMWVASDLLVTEDKLYCMANSFTLWEIDLETYAARKFFTPESTRKYPAVLKFLDCSEDTLYIKEEVLYDPSGYHISGLARFRVWAVDRSTGELTDLTGLLDVTSVTSGCGGSLYFVGKDERILNKMDFVTGEVSPVGQLDTDMAVDRTVVGGHLLVRTEEDNYLFSVETGEFRDDLYCGFEISELVQQMPNYVVFTAGRGNLARTWIADREAFEQQRLNKAEMVKVNYDLE